MSGTVELDPDGTTLVIRFPYREDLVALVKELPQRRWDPRQKVWRVPATLVEKVFATFSRHLFDFAPEIPALLAGTLGTSRPAAPSATPPVAPGESPPPAVSHPDNPPSLRISELNHRIRDVLRRQFAESFWVIGEIVDLDKSAGREHRFFQLVEKARGAARPVAAVEVALFGSVAARLEARCRNLDTPFHLRDGIEVRMQVKVDFYPGSGRFQLVVEDVDPSFTLGKLALSREQLLKELHDQGLADRNRALGFPVPALRIGVLSSPDSDGWNDFVRHLQEAPIGFAVSLWPIKVQGVELQPSLLQGLAWFADHAADFDVLCIVRGGGSKTDLAWFDDRAVAFAVARHPLKVLVGIGHQRDQSVLDRIAHSEKTPTAVAALLVDAALATRADHAERVRRLAAAVHDRLADEQRALAAVAQCLGRGTDRHLARQRTRLALAGRGLQAACQRRLTAETGQLRLAARGLEQFAARRLERATAWLAEAATRHRLLDPARVLGRGYALVRDGAGKVLPAAARLATGQAIVVQFRDGRASAHVTALDQAQP